MAAALVAMFISMRPLDPIFEGSLTPPEHHIHGDAIRQHQNHDVVPRQHFSRVHGDSGAGVA
jgi:hypothetical protein